MVGIVIHFTLYSRSYCHLCDDMLQALQAVLGDAPGFSIEVIDIDANDDLVAKYDELVPVLLGSNGSGASVQLCHYFLDRAKLESFITQPAGSGI